MFDKCIIANILKFTETGADYKNFCLVSKTWYKTINTIYPKGYAFTNHILTLLKLFPDDIWSYKNLSRNPNITWEYVQNNKNKGWDHIYLMLRSDFKELDIVYELHDIENDNIEHCCYNDCVKYQLRRAATLYKWDFLKDHFTEIARMRPQYLSRNPIITLNIVLEHPEVNWNVYSLYCYNPSIKWEDICILDNILLDKKDLKTYKKIYKALSKTKKITIDIVKKNPDKPWNYYKLSRNLNITWEIVKANPDIPWDYIELSKNPNITWDIIQKNPKIFPNHKFYSNPNLTWDIVKENFYFTWYCFDKISKNSFGRPDVLWRPY